MNEKQTQRSLTDPPADDADDRSDPSDDPPGDPPDDEPGRPADAGDGEGPSFEEALEELETIVEELEEGKLGLEEAMERFEEGLSLVKTCRGKLQQAELKVEELLEDGETEELS